MVYTVAEIVAANIHAMPCECDVYPSPCSLELSDLQAAVPQTLHSLIAGNHISARTPLPNYYKK